jgi:Predicted periplasmic lipoprotein (DUF2279)
LVAAALAVLFHAPAADAQSYLQPNDTAQETYVVDSKGTTLYRDGVKVCRFNCAPVAIPVPRSTPPPTPFMPPPTTPDRYVAADRYPIRPPTPAAPQTYPVRPAPIRASAPAPVAAPTRAYAQTTNPQTPAAASPAAPAAPYTTAPTPQKHDGLSKEQKALLLNAGGVLAITTYGLVFWDYFQTAPKADGEGWFGRTTKYGGADKLGHFWSTYAVGHLFSYVYRWWDFDREQANTLGALSSLSVQTLMEAGDAFSADYGFSYEDELMNIAGAGAAYILGKYPELARKIDFRFEYRPTKFSDLTHDVLTNYDNQRYLIALKLDGFDMFHDSYLSYLELQAGYYTRGYEEWDPGKPDNRRRHLYFGVGFNVSKLVQNFVDTGFFDYIQVPYTTIGVSKRLD